MWPFDDIVDFSPFYNLILGIALLFAGMFAFKYVPGRFLSIIAGLGIIGLGIALILGYVVIL